LVLTISNGNPLYARDTNIQTYTETYRETVVNVCMVPVEWQDNEVIAAMPHSTYVSYVYDIRGSALLTSTDSITQRAADDVPCTVDIPYSL